MWREKRRSSLSDVAPRSWLFQTAAGHTHTHKKVDKFFCKKVEGRGRRGEGRGRGGQVLKNQPVSTPSTTAPFSLKVDKQSSSTFFVVASPEGRREKNISFFLRRKNMGVCRRVVTFSTTVNFRYGKKIFTVKTEGALLQCIKKLQRNLHL